MEPPEHLELHVRSLTTRGGGQAQEAAVERLRSIERREGVEGTSVHVWGEEVALSTTAAETEAGRQIIERVEAFREWADRAGVSVERPFEVCERECRLTGQTHAIMCLPVRVLAEIRDGDVVYVTPHEADGEVVTVTDRLARLDEAGYDASRRGTVAP